MSLALKLPKLNLELLRQPRVTSFLAGLGFVVLAGGMQTTVRSLTTGERPLVQPPEQYIGTAVDPRIIQRLLGLRMLAADLIWIDTMMKSDTKREGVPFTAFYRAVKTIVTLDPDNVYAYYVGGIYLSVIKDDVRAASELLRAGVRHLETHDTSWADAWRIPFTLGYNLLFEEQEIEEGSQWITKASEMPDAPEFVRTLGKRVSTDQGRFEVGNRVLLDLYRRVDKPEEKARIQQKLTALAVRQELADLNHRFQEFVTSTGAYAFSKKRQLQLFFRTIGHSGKDAEGRLLSLCADGKICTGEGN